MRFGSRRTANLEVKDRVSRRWTLIDPSFQMPIVCAGFSGARVTSCTRARACRRHGRRAEIEGPRMVKETYADGPACTCVVW